MLELLLQSLLRVQHPVRNLPGQCVRNVRDGTESVCCPVGFFCRRVPTARIVPHAFHSAAVLRCEG